jgi:hypothetical protein
MMSSSLSGVILVSLRRLSDTVELDSSEVKWQIRLH